MKVLLTGATGLIGAEIAGRLVGLGHEVVAVSRRRVTQRQLGTRTVCLDFGSAVLNDGLGHLAGVDAVVNCVGVLQDSARTHPKPRMPADRQFSSKPARRQASDA
jgi:uncharacterized protein YbjT (DUF2867 family)